MSEPLERRKADRRNTISGTVEDKIDALIGMFTVHMTKEELDIQELKHKIDEYFHELDARTHIFHHNKVAENIKDNEDSHNFWYKIKSSVTEKVILFVLGGIATYIAALIWLDFGTRMNNLPPRPIPPAITVPAQPANPNVTNHP